MSVRNRYEIVRKYYKDCVILILIRKKLYIYKDNILVDFKSINRLKELHINYIILDNLEVIERKYEDNNYEEYYLKDKLNNILDNILDRLKKGLEEKWKKVILLFLHF